MRGLALLLLLAACAAVAQPKAPTTLLATRPPASWAEQLAYLEACSGLHLPFPLDSLEVLVVPGDAFTVRGSSSLFVGYAYLETRSVAIVADSVQSPGLVRHELLHHMIRRPGHPDFPGTVPCGVW